MQRSKTRATPVSDSLLRSSGSEHTYLAARHAEWVDDLSPVRSPLSGDTFKVSQKSIPVKGGIEAHLWKKSRLRIVHISVCALIVDSVPTLQSIFIVLVWIPIIHCFLYKINGFLFEFRFLISIIVRTAIPVRIKIEYGHSFIGQKIPNRSFNIATHVSIGNIG